jgi:prolyl-tRNA editing enzyme YbaK/EbsC (Cys-tRNA(Pro) deacylase)
LEARKVSFASSEQTIENTGMEIGGVTVFGLPEGLPVWIDSRVMTRQWVIVGAGSRSAKVRVDPSVFTSLSGFEVVEELAREIAID